MNSETHADRVYGSICFELESPSVQYGAQNYQSDKWTGLGPHLQATVRSSSLGSPRIRVVFLPIQIRYYE